jgi:glutamate-1-semialdehyde 2,1-aminomutase
LGGGFPVAALGGKREIMRLVADGTVSMAGTYSANGIAVAAANAALDELSAPGKYQALFARCETLYEGLRKLLDKHGLPAYVVGVGPVSQVWFAERPIRNYRDAARYADHELFRRWWEGMLENDVLFHPGAFENLFVSFAHSEDDIERTLEAADTVMRGLSKHV